jgi:hypothetical protein
MSHEIVKSFPAHVPSNSPSDKVRESAKSSTPALSPFSPAYPADAAKMSTQASKRILNNLICFTVFPPFLFKKKLIVYKSVQWISYM